MDYDLKSYYQTCFEIEATYLLYFHALGIGIVLFIDNQQSLRPQRKIRALSFIKEGEIHFESLKNAWN
uniref:Uncharacterized protein n=1 Tax=Panagrolaimus sp. PS1159 TaxID=55785 RepID=A0AC35GMW6_9BILA